MVYRAGVLCAAWAALVAAYARSAPADVDTPYVVVLAGWGAVRLGRGRWPREASADRLCGQVILAVAGIIARKASTGGVGAVAVSTGETPPAYGAL